MACMGQPCISFTFDDGSTAKHGNYSFEDWNERILSTLDKADIKAVFFVTTQNKANKKGKFLLESWNKNGHLIANHTPTHPNFNNSSVTAEDFREELLKADSIISNYSNYTKLFRFPYLKEGNTASKVDSIRHIMKQNGYTNGYVTVDASDWYIDSRLRKRLRTNPEADITPYKTYYLEHLLEGATYYEQLSYTLTGRHIKHTLLLHHNLSAALFLDDLIDLFKSNGWKVISADEAYNDPIFKQKPKQAGESLIWSLAKDSGLFDQQLRYPAEDSQYEKERMDKRGL